MRCDPSYGSWEYWYSKAFQGKSSLLQPVAVAKRQPLPWKPEVSSQTPKAHRPWLWWFHLSACVASPGQTTHSENTPNDLPKAQSLEATQRWQATSTTCCNQYRCSLQLIVIGGLSITKLTSRICSYSLAVIPSAAVTLSRNFLMASPNRGIWAKLDIQAFSI